MGDRCASVLALSPQVENWVQSQTTWRDKSQERCDRSTERGHFEFGRSTPPPEDNSSIGFCSVRIVFDISDLFCSILKAFVIYAVE